MALHQFKTKHNSMYDPYRNSMDESPRNTDYESKCSSFDHHGSSMHEPQRTSVLRVKKKSSDPILLYRPSNGLPDPVLQSREQEDLFSACHKDLIQESKSSLNPYQSLEYDDSTLKCTQSCCGMDNRSEGPFPERGYFSRKRTSPTSRVSQDTSSLSWSVKRNEHNNRKPCHTQSTISPCKNSNTTYTLWKDTMSMPTCPVSTEANELQQHFSNPMESEMPSCRSPVIRQHSPIHHDRQDRTSHIKESFKMADKTNQVSTREFVNTNRMLVEGVRLVCDGAIETMSRMQNEKREEHNFTEDFDRVNGPSSDESCSNSTDKLNFIQSAFLQLANCNDPDILHEARRIIPVPLLQRLLQQLQEDSSGLPGIHGIT